MAHAFLDRKISLTVITTTAIGLLVSIGAYAARGAVQDRTISLDQAKKYAETASQGSVIPLTVNDKVLAKLNRYAGSPEGREWMRKVLNRMPTYRAMIEGKLAAAKLPSELLAVPIIESGYENLAHSPGSGLWGFIPGSARKFGLVVNEKTDERMDPAKETDAAVRYFQKLNEIFEGDWLLSLKSYNEGEGRVLASLKREKVSSAWELEDRKESADKYLASFTAVVILFKNRQLLD